MAGVPVTNKIIRGTFGRLWINGKKYANVKKYEAKVKLQYEKVDINGELCEQNRYIGYDISGTVDLFKIDSRIAAIYKEGIVTGNLPDVKFVSKVADPAVEGAERVELYDVKFDEATLAAFENKKITEESVPFTAGGFKYLDLIDEE